MPKHTKVKDSKEVVSPLEENIDDDHKATVKDLMEEINRKTDSIQLNTQEITRLRSTIIGLTEEKGYLQIEVQELKAALVKKDEEILSMRTGFKEALTYPHNALKKKCEEFNAFKAQFEEVKLENTQLKQEIETLKTALMVYIVILILI
jgi:chromosome segregation ATPase